MSKHKSYLRTYLKQNKNIEFNTIIMLIRKVKIALFIISKLLRAYSLYFDVL